MSEQNVNPSISPDEEKKILVQNLRKMGKEAKLSHSLETLRAMYNNALNGEDEKDEDIEDTDITDTSTDIDNTKDNVKDNAKDEVKDNAKNETKNEVKNTEDKSVKKTKAEILNELRNKIRKEKTALIRCRITCHNPNKQDIPGEYFTVANEIVGNIRKFVPFGNATENGYHIPRAIVDLLKDRKFQRIFTKKNESNVQIVDLEKSKLVNEFTVEELPPLTPAELEELKQRQIATRSLEDN